MELKLYAIGIESKQDEENIAKAVSNIAGVDTCIPNSEKAQIFLNFDESVENCEKNAREAIEALGFQILN